MEFFWQKRKRIKLEAVRKKQTEELASRQKEIGLSIVKVLKEAASENKEYNLYKDGARSSSVKPMIVKTLPVNGSNFTILTGVPCDGVSVGSILGVKGYEAYQIDINLSNKNHELHVFTCPYGPDRSWTLNDLNSFQKAICQMVREFTLFPKT